MLQLDAGFQPAPAAHPVPGWIASKQWGSWAVVGLALKPVFGMALVLAGLLAVAPRLRAQAPDSGNASGSSQSQPAANSQNSAPAQDPSRVKTQTNRNPFPEDTNSVPVMPSNNLSGLPPEAGSARIPVPLEDADPVRSPENAAAAAESSESSSSSSLAGLGNLLQPPDDETQTGKHGRKGQEVAPEHHETAAEDENVGNYYLSNKDWKGALSRFQSALVLDPYNPDVYWGLAESERHLGNFAEARANYQKVVDYDPESRHGKDARKALKDPEIANAKPAPAKPAAQ
jgi:tetratricopeptide (TPR) repeat protein